MKFKFLLPLSLVFFFSTNALAATTYFSCVVNEPHAEVTVKFAVKDLDVYKDKGELLTYPGLEDVEDSGAILVSPQEINDRYSIMSNLNSQGGDLRIEGYNIRLFGDGDGYQFTDLVIWDVDDVEEGTVEGYVRDYGSAYSEGEEHFKQFIKCQKSLSVL